MMNYLAKYSIAQCILSGQKKDLTEGTAIVGILELTSKGIFETNFSEMDVDINIRSAITVESRLGGGVGFPNREHAFSVMSGDHTNFINVFLDTIPQERILLFDDGEMYASVMMMLVMKLAQERGKNVVCVSSGPLRIRSRKIFNASWEEIGTEADKSILFDLPPIEIESNTIRDFCISRHKEIWKYVYEFWTKLNNQK